MSWRGLGLPGGHGHSSRAQILDSCLARFTCRCYAVLQVMLDLLMRDKSKHDFGGEIIPMASSDYKVGELPALPLKEWLRGLAGVIRMWCGGNSQRQTDKKPGKTHLCFLLLPYFLLPLHVGHVERR